MCAAREQIVGRDLGLFGEPIGIVVVDFVIVPGDDPGECGMRLLQVGIGLVQRVAHPVIVDGRNLVADMRSHLTFARATLVDVVAQMNDQVEVFAGHVLVSGVQPALVVLAGGEGET